MEILNKKTMAWALKLLSKREWAVPELAPSNEQLQTSALMRIADATELMAQNYLKMQNDLEYLRSRNRDLIEDNERMVRRISALRGVITKMKKAKELTIKVEEK